jgi:hypothetical protein
LYKWLDIGENDSMDEASEQTQDGFVRCFLFFYELSDEWEKVQNTTPIETIF